MSDITTAAMTDVAAAIVALYTTPHLGVGDSSTAQTAAQTDLQATTNKLRKACSVFSSAGAVITAQAQFATGEANFAWNEVGLFRASSGSTMYVRKVQSIGTKTSAAAWTLELTITHTAG